MGFLSSLLMGAHFLRFRSHHDSSRGVRGTLEKRRGVTIHHREPNPSPSIGENAMKACKGHLAIALLLILAPLTAAAGVPSISGTITARQTDPGAPGAWRYEMNVQWDTHNTLSLSHLNLSLEQLLALLDDLDERL